MTYGNLSDALFDARQAIIECMAYDYWNYDDIIKAEAAKIAADMDKLINLIGR